MILLKIIFSEVWVDKLKFWPTGDLKKNLFFFHFIFHPNLTQTPENSFVTQKEHKSLE